MLHDIILLMAGAAIVCIGQLAQALVERISGRRGERERARAPRTERTRKHDGHDERQAIPREVADARIADARSALSNLGYHPKVAHAAVDRALGKMRAGYASEDLTREALKQCPKASAEVA